MELFNIFNNCKRKLKVNYMDIYDFIYPISEKQILELAKVNGPCNNVVVGIDKHCFGVTFGESGDICQFLYVNGTIQLKGYLLQIQLAEKNFYPLVVEFTYMMTIEFDLIDPVDLYNALIKNFRSAIEIQGIQTVTNFDLRLLNEKFGENYLISAGPIMVIYYLNKLEFYQTIVGDNHLAIEADKNYVYLLINCRNGLFKIGRSKNPLQREKTLQAEEPEILLIKYWAAEKAFENTLHKRYLTKRIRGEWFKLNLNDLLELRKVADELNLSK